MLISSYLGKQESLSEMAKELGKPFANTLEHTERVKWYAPHIRHVVLDIRCRATSAPAALPAQPAPAAGIPGALHNVIAQTGGNLGSLKH